MQKLLLVPNKTQKISGGLRPPNPRPGAPPLDPAGGCAPRPLPDLPRRRKRRLGRTPSPHRNGSLRSQISERIFLRANERKNPFGR